MYRVHNAINTDCGIHECDNKAEEEKPSSHYGLDRVIDRVLVFPAVFKDIGSQGETPAIIAASGQLSL
jgi:hypothetical protein